MIKKFFAFVLSVVMTSTCMQCVFAQIEVWEFDDGSRLTRFHRDDFLDMIGLYGQYVQKNKQKLLTRRESLAVKLIGISIGTVAVIGGLVVSNLGDATVREKIGGYTLIAAGVSSILGSLYYPKHIECQVARKNTKDAYIKISGDKYLDELRRNSVSYFGIQDVYDMLVKEKHLVDQVLATGNEDMSKKLLKTDEVCSGLEEIAKYGLTRDVLQKCFGYYVLLERPYGSCKPTDNEYVKPLFHSDYWLGEDWTRNKCERIILQIVNNLRDRQCVYEKKFYVVSRKGIYFNEWLVSGYDF